MLAAIAALAGCGGGGGSGKALAVMLKYSLIKQDIEDRAYAVSFAPIAK